MPARAVDPAARSAPVIRSEDVLGNMSPNDANDSLYEINFTLISSRSAINPRSNLQRKGETRHERPV